MTDDRLLYSADGSNMCTRYLRDDCIARIVGFRGAS